MTELLRHSATVILLRQGKPKFELLMLQKNHRINFGGSWVFPGGVIEEIDRQHATRVSLENNPIELAKFAAVRETKEETGLSIERDSLVPYAHWVTPFGIKKRYATWFFICDSLGLHNDIEIDQEEIIDHLWISPQQALKEHIENGMKLNGPSFIAMHELSNYKQSIEVLNDILDRGPETHLPQASLHDGTAYVVHAGDHAYGETHVNEQQLFEEGPRHRIVMHKDKPWEYQKTL